MSAHNFAVPAANFLHGYQPKCSIYIIGIGSCSLVFILNKVGSFKQLFKVTLWLPSRQRTGIFVVRVPATGLQ